MNLLPKPSQSGYIGMTIIAFLIVISAVLYPFKFPVSNLSGTDGTHYCRQFYTAPDPPTFEYGGATYKLIKMNVPVDRQKLEGDHHVGYEDNINVNGGNYQVLNPENGAGRSYDFNTEDGITDITFSDYGLRYLLHLDTITPEQIEIKGAGLEVIDIYQDVSKPPLPEAENITKCVDQGVTSIISPQVMVPNQSASPDKDELQLEWFYIKSSKLLPKAWWTPECKPAIYLYPGQKQLVNVRVYPKGELGFTDPPYKSGSGWTVTAYPSGRLTGLQNESVKGNYLYYESKIWDSVLKKPETGWVVKYEDLENLFEDKLPLLGLNEKEKTDFMDYWLKQLPDSPYYFVGLVDKEQRDYLEPLSVIPPPDTSIRFSFYFEMLDQTMSIEEPKISTPERKGFTLVDWGGLMKLRPGTPFTCSQ